MQTSGGSVEFCEILYVILHVYMCLCPQAGEATNISKENRYEKREILDLRSRVVQALQTNPIPYRNVARRTAKTSKHA